MRTDCLRAAAVWIVTVVVWSAARVAAACPTCKDGLAHDDPALSGVAQGFSYSIFLMMSMPFLIFGGLAAYFYWEVCRARRRMADREELGSIPSAG